MKVTILGSGSFIQSLDHFGPGYLLEVDSKKILIDAGQGTMIQLLKLGLKVDDLDYIFITHFHSDHVADLLQIVMRYKINRRKDPNEKMTLTIFGSDNITEFIRSSLINCSLQKFLEPFGVETKVIKDKVYLGDLSIEPYNVEHAGATAYAYRFEADGKVFTFSGDSIICDGLEQAAKGADVFICDSSLPKDGEPTVHPTTTQIGELCTKANVKKVILSHLTPAVFDVDLVAEVKENFNGEVVLAKDLMEIEV